MMDFLEMTRGGLVFDMEVARRLAEFLLEAHCDKGELEQQFPLEILDKGKFWQVSGSGPRTHDDNAARVALMAIAKFDGAVSDFRFLASPLIDSAALASRYGELLWKAHHGEEECHIQQPFTAIDKGDHWQVDGSRNRDRKVEGLGAFFMSVNKRDGRVADFGSWYSLHTPPEVQAILKAAQRRKDDSKIN